MTHELWSLLFIACLIFFILGILLIGPNKPDEWDTGDDEKTWDKDDEPWK